MEPDYEGTDWGDVLRRVVLGIAGGITGALAGLIIAVIYSAAILPWSVGLAMAGTIYFASLNEKKPRR